VFIAIDKNTHQIGIFDCSDAFYESGLDKVQRAVEQYKLFYETPDFDPQQFFINKTL
jgi:phosphosulfolactate synthase (CoM biosynthesis protein A)